MPCIQIRTNVASYDADDLLLDVSAVASEVMGKPETYMMVTIDHSDMLMGGLPGPASFIVVRGIGGLSPEVNKKLSKTLSELLNRELSIPCARTYVVFDDVAASDWGTNGTTIG
jgi:phenylpyruvate tautomerase PptA (4-oxalocrotonate tautomerase family)